MTQEHLTRNVFVAGGVPDVTYNPRDDRRIENEVRSYLDQSGKALSLSGPTKSGKTVLIRRTLPEHAAIWMHGSDLVGQDAFWDKIIDWLGLYDQVEVSRGNTADIKSKIAGSIGTAGTKVESQVGGNTITNRNMKWSRSRGLADVAREGLRTLPVPIVIDDFHYVPDTVKREIARAIKSIIPITPVVMIAVPHEAFEVVREEPDMGARVWHQRIEHWNAQELSFIAESGFAALNIEDAGKDVTQRLVGNSFGAPFLMQQLCYDIATHHNILATANETFTLPTEPGGGWSDFLRRIADRSTPPVFDRLRRGPKTRGQERVERVFRHGPTTDIYGAVLYTIGQSGPKADLPQQEIVKALNANLVDGARGQEVTNCLAQMSKIADEMRGAGDPALVYRKDVLHILDPFLLFYLRWGAQKN